MASPPKCELLGFPDNIMTTLRTAYNLGEPGKIDEVLDNLQDWIKAQNHFLKKDFNRHYLETGLITCKGDLEKAKARFDKLCTLRTILPDYYDNVNPKDLAGLDKSAGGTLSKMDNNNYRVTVLKDLGSTYTTEAFKNFFKLQINLAEYLRNYDYCDGQVLVFDCSEINFMDLISAIDLVQLRHVLTLLVEGYGMRIRGLHVVVAPGTVSKALDMLSNILKGLVSENIADRLKFHTSIDTVFEYVPKDIMPSDYGGKEISMKELQDKWMNVLSSPEHMKTMKEISEAKIDAASVDALFEEHLGTAANFRKLELD